MDPVDNKSPQCFAEGKDDNAQQAIQSEIAVPYKPEKLLLDRRITLSAALEQDEDMTMELSYNKARARLYYGLEDRLREIQELVAFHCGLTDLNPRPHYFGGSRIEVDQRKLQLVYSCVHRPKREYTAIQARISSSSTI